MDPHILELGRKLWNYMLMHHSLQKADVIIVPGSLNPTPAKRASEVYKQGWAPLILMVGGLGRVTKNYFKTSEAEMYAKIAVDMGVPKEKILIENQSTNTGENITFSRQVLEKHGVHPKKIIVVQKPYAERRFYAAFMKLWPGPDYIMTSPQISYNDWVAEYKLGGRVISFIVGDLQRILVYPHKGWQIPQSVPKDIMKAYDELVSLGFTEHLYKE